MPGYQYCHMSWLVSSWKDICMSFLCIACSAYSFDLSCHGHFFVNLCYHPHFHHPAGRANLTANVLWSCYQSQTERRQHKLSLKNLTKKLQLKPSLMHADPQWISCHRILQDQLDANNTGREAKRKTSKPKVNQSRWPSPTVITMTC